MYRQKVVCYIYDEPVDFKKLNPIEGFKNMFSTFCPFASLFAKKGTKFNEKDV